jgi:hypothetical protein
MAAARAPPEIRGDNRSSHWDGIAAYLMMPPPNAPGAKTVSLGADLSLWAIYDS